MKLKTLKDEIEGEWGGYRGHIKTEKVLQFLRDVFEDIRLSENRDDKIVPRGKHKLKLGILDSGGIGKQEVYNILKEKSGFTEEEIKGEENKLSKLQKSQLEEIRNKIQKFQCNHDEGLKFDCNEDCPFKIKGIPAIHKWSKGCLNKYLFDLLQEAGEEK